MAQQLRTCEAQASEAFAALRHRLLAREADDPAVTMRAAVTEMFSRPIPSVSCSQIFHVYQLYLLAKYTIGYARKLLRSSQALDLIQWTSRCMTDLVMKLAANDEFETMLEESLHVAEKEGFPRAFTIACLSVPLYLPPGHRSRRASLLIILRKACLKRGGSIEYMLVSLLLHHLSPGTNTVGLPTPSTHSQLVSSVSTFFHRQLPVALVVALVGRHPGELLLSWLSLQESTSSPTSTVSPLIWLLSQRVSEVIPIMSLKSFKEEREVSLTSEIDTLIQYIHSLLHLETAMDRDTLESLLHTSLIPALDHILVMFGCTAPLSSLISYVQEEVTPVQKQPLVTLLEALRLRLATYAKGVITSSLDCHTLGLFLLTPREKQERGFRTLQGLHCILLLMGLCHFALAPLTTMKDVLLSVLKGYGRLASRSSWVLLPTEIALAKLVSGRDYRVGEVKRMASGCWLEAPDLLVGEPKVSVLKLLSLPLPADFKDSLALLCDERPDGQEPFLMISTFTSIVRINGQRVRLSLPALLLLSLSRYSYGEVLHIFNTVFGTALDLELLTEAQQSLARLPIPFSMPRTPGSQRRALQSRICQYVKQNGQVCRQTLAASLTADPAETARELASLINAGHLDADEDQVYWMLK